MDSAHPENSFDHFSLKQTADILNVSVDTLIEWNDNNIFKPTITKDGEVCYKKEQIEKFLEIQKSLQNINTALQKAPLMVHKSLPLQSEISEPGFPNQQIKNPQSEKINKPYLKHSKTARTFIPTFILTFFTIFTLATSLISLANKKNPNTGLKKESISLDSSVKNLTNEKDESYIPPSQQGYESLNNPELKSIDSVALRDLASRPNIGTSEKISNIDKLSIDLGIKSTVPDNGTSKNRYLIIPLISLPAAILIFLYYKKQLAYNSLGQGVLEDKLVSSTSDFYPLDQKVLEINQKTDGTVVLNLLSDEIKISKPELGSESDQFIERLLSFTSNNIKEVNYDLLNDKEIKLNAPLSKLVTRLGFVGLKRDLFFPRTSKNSVLFRKYLTETDLISMGLTLERVVKELSN